MTNDNRAMVEAAISLCEKCDKRTSGGKLSMLGCSGCEDGFIYQSDEARQIIEWMRTTKYYPSRPFSAVDVVEIVLTQSALAVAAERTRIADELEQIVWATNSDLRHKTIGDACDANGDECLVCDVNDKVAAFYEQLRGADNDGTK